MKIITKFFVFLMLIFIGTSCTTEELLDENTNSFENETVINSDGRASFDPNGVNLEHGPGIEPNGITSSISVVESDLGPSITPDGRGNFDPNGVNPDNGPGLEPNGVNSNEESEENSNEESEENSNEESDPDSDSND